ncbi:MAG: hypothetical protein ACRDRL_08440, partial [Sciscionella sp.]
MLKSAARFQRLILRGFAMGSVVAFDAGEEHGDQVDSNALPEASSLTPINAGPDESPAGVGAAAAQSAGDETGLSRELAGEEPTPPAADSHEVERFLVLTAAIAATVVVPATLAGVRLGGVTLVLGCVGVALASLGIAILVVRPFPRLHKAFAVSLAALCVVSGCAGMAAAGTLKATEHNAHIKVIPKPKHGLVIAARLALSTSPVALSIAGDELAVLGQSHDVQVFDTFDLSAPPVDRSTPQDASDVSIFGPIVALSGAGRGWIDRLAGAQLIQGKTENFGTVAGDVVVVGAITWMTNVTHAKVERYALGDPYPMVLPVPGQPKAICAYPGGGVVIAADDARHGVG